jgi:hypothetical protein
MYVHKRFQKFFQGLYSRTPFKQGRGREGKGRGGREGRRDGSRDGKGGREDGKEGKGDVCIHPSGGIRCAVWHICSTCCQLILKLNESRKELLQLQSTFATSIFQLHGTSQMVDQS